MVLAKSHGVSLVLVAFVMGSLPFAQTRRLPLAHHIDQPADILEAPPKEDVIQVNPAASTATLFVHGFSAAQGTWFCYKVAVGKEIEQMTHGVKENWDNAKCKKEWQKDFAIGTLAPSQPASSSKQSYVGGDSRLCPGGQARSSQLSVFLRQAAEDVSIHVTEPKACEYEVQVFAPASELELPKLTPIVPSSLNGAEFFILGKSEVHGGECYCYRIVTGDFISQRIRDVKCTWTNEDCRKDWQEDKLVGKMESESAMEQSYTKGTSEVGCQTPNKEREAVLTMFVDSDSKDVSIQVEEPLTACSYAVSVFLPLADVGHFK